MSDSLYKACAVVGAATLGYLGIKTLSELRFQLHSSKLQRYQHGNEPWVLVTGASDGIGLAFVNELAEQGWNVILHGRNETKLNKIIAELKPKYKVKFKTLILDAGAAIDSSFDKKILSAIKGLNLTVVVHNVAGNGGSVVEMNMFDELTPAKVDGWIDCNIRFQTHLTRVLLPELLKRQPGLMLWMSSAVTEISTPGVPLYTGAKAYIEGLVRCLKLEMKMNSHDIEMMSLTCGMVQTVNSGRHEKDISFTMPSTKTFVKSALGKVGYGSPKVSPYIGHEVMFGFVTSLPMWLQDVMMLRMGRQAKEQMEKGR